MPYLIRCGHSGYAEDWCWVLRSRSLSTSALASTARVKPEGLVIRNNCYFSILYATTMFNQERTGECASGESFPGGPASGGLGGTKYLARTHNSQKPPKTLKRSQKIEIIFILGGPWAEDFLCWSTFTLARYFSCPIILSSLPLYGGGLLCITVWSCLGHITSITFTLLFVKCDRWWCDRL